MILSTYIDKHYDDVIAVYAWSIRVYLNQAKGVTDRKLFNLLLKE